MYKERGEGAAENRGGIVPDGNVNKDELAGPDVDVTEDRDRDRGPRTVTEDGAHLFPSRGIGRNRRPDDRRPNDRIIL